MSTTARKIRKRARRAALDRGDTALAESLRFQHPRRTSTTPHPSQRLRPMRVPNALSSFMRWLRGCPPGARRRHEESRAATRLPDPVGGTT